MPAAHRHPASFRDPSGFVFEWGGTFYRQVNQVYSAHYDKLMSSGLYEQLVSNNLLIAHSEVTAPVAEPTGWYKTVQPQHLEVISYPYEWCFEQVKDAALLTLKIAQLAISKGMVLKDATPFNVQFVGARPIFIDLLSFELYNEHEPWVAYHQFCTQFLFPLYIAAYTGTPVNKLYKAWPQGIDATLCWKLLPASARLSAGVWMNVYLQKSIASSSPKKNQSKFSKNKMLRLLDHLHSQVASLKSSSVKTAWYHYYQAGVLGGNYVNNKARALHEFTIGINSNITLDLGCNDGRFTEVLAACSKLVVAVDDDEKTISRFYRRLNSRNDLSTFPLILDAADPSSAQGFASAEHAAFFDRVKPDLVVALALIHHLVISRNISLSILAVWLSAFATKLVIEWVPKEDEKVVQLLAHRKDVFEDYHIDTFEQEFGRFFIISKKVEIGSSNRVLYLMEKR